MKRFLSIIFSLFLLLSLAGCSQQPSTPQPTTPPTNITVWTYYNGDTLAAFETLVSKFNETVGKEKNIVVSSFSYGSVTDLEASVLSGARGEAGAKKIPNIFMAYSDTAYTLNEMGILVDISDYMTEEELSLYVDSYIAEGDLTGIGELKIFPTAKSTEIFCMNKTDWDKFSAATGIVLSDLATIEGIVSVAGAYYEWTDSQTETPNDGKAFFGYDAMDNYFIIGAMQLGTELFSMNNGTEAVNFHKETIRKLWDCFYVPFVKGHFSASGRFRSDDVKTGNAIAYIGSSASATYFPNRVIISDTESYPIEMLALPCPMFEGAKEYAVQQGAGMAVTAGSEQEITASVEFLKWFTSPENNISFSVNSGYLPVSKAGNDVNAIISSEVEITPNMEQVITAAVSTVNDRQLYTPPVISGGTEIRNILKYCLLDQAVADRETILAACASGTALEDALLFYLSDEAFEAWYADTLEQLMQCGVQS